MRALSRFMSGFLGADDIALGRLVASTKNPTRKSHDSQTFELSKEKFSRNEFTNIYALTEAKSSSTFEVALTKLLDLLIKKSGSAAESVKSNKAVRYELLNPEDRLDEILDDEAKRWVTRANVRSRVYLVTEIHTIEDASLSLGRRETTEFKGQAILPASYLAEAVAPGATTLHPGGKALAEAADPKLKLNLEQTQKERIRLIAPGERVFAVGYSEVILRKKQNESPELAKKVVWRSFDGSRGEKDKHIEVEAFVRELDDALEQEQVAATVCGYRDTFIIYGDSLKDN